MREIAEQVVGRQHREAGDTGRERDICERQRVAGEVAARSQRAATFDGYGLKKLRAAKSVAAATKVFENEFEVCGECDESRRVAQAQVTLREYGGCQDQALDQRKM